MKVEGWSFQLLLVLLNGTSQILSDNFEVRSLPLRKMSPKTQICFFSPPPRRKFIWSGSTTTHRVFHQSTLLCKNRKQRPRGSRDSATDLLLRNEWIHFSRLCTKTLTSFAEVVELTQPQCIVVPAAQCTVQDVMCGWLDHSFSDSSSFSFPKRNDEYLFRKPIPKHTFSTPRPRYLIPNINTHSWASLPGSAEPLYKCLADATYQRLLTHTSLPTGYLRPCKLHSNSTQLPRQEQSDISMVGVLGLFPVYVFRTVFCMSPHPVWIQVARRG